MPYSDQVDGTRAREHLRYLRDEGMSIAQIQFASGVNRTALRALLGEFPNRKRTEQVRIGTERAILRTRVNRGVSIAGMVPAIGTVRRIQALACMRWPHGQIALHVGYDRLQVGRSGEVRAQRAIEVMAVYDELRDKLGPSRRIAEYARYRGWLGPNWWDEDTIDDPLAFPEGVATYVNGVLDDDISLPRPERIDLLTRRGYSTEEIAERIGTQIRYVHKDRLEYTR